MEHCDESISWHSESLGGTTPSKSSFLIQVAIRFGLSFPRERKFFVLHVFGIFIDSRIKGRKTKHYNFNQFS